MYNMTIFCDTSCHQLRTVVLSFLPYTTGKQQLDEEMPKIWHRGIWTSVLECLHSQGVVFSCGETQKNKDFCSNALFMYFLDYQKSDIIQLGRIFKI